MCYAALFLSIVGAIIGFKLLQAWWKDLGLIPELIAERTAPLKAETEQLQAEIAHLREEKTRLQEEKTRLQEEKTRRNIKL